MKEENEEEKKELFSEEELENGLSEEALEAKGLKISETWLYKLFVKSAYRLLEKPLAVLGILKKAFARIQEYDTIKDFTKDVQEQLATIIRLVRAYVKGDYREISKVNIALTFGAIIYFMAPFDLIPDFLAIGLLDDIAILTWVYENFRSEINGFLEWEDEQKIRIEVSEDNIAKE